MRRLMSITAFALFLSLPLWAQRGAGHAGAARGTFSTARGFSGAHFGGGHFSAPMRAGFSHGFRSSGISRGFHSRGFSRGPYLHNGFPRRFHTDGLRKNCFGWGCRGNRRGYPGWGWGYYEPWLWNWWNDDYSFDEDYNRNLAIANDMDQQSLEEQRVRRQEESDGDRDSYAPHSYSSNREPRQEQQSKPVLSPTVLVFRDQHQKEIRNYAIVGETLWNFSGQRTEKIPLADLDLTATVKANDDRGVTFRVPGSNEGQ